MNRFRRSSRTRSPKVRIGTDLVNVASIQESIDRFGTRYLERIYTANEIDYCERSPAERIRRYAARFAAKEATLKVLRPSGHWLDWRNIEVVRSSAGWCEIHLRGPAKFMALRARITSLSVSLSHEDQYAFAVVSGTIH